MGPSRQGSPIPLFAHAESGPCGLGSSFTSFSIDKHPKLLPDPPFTGVVRSLKSARLLSLRQELLQVEVLW